VIMLKKYDFLILLVLTAFLILVFVPIFTIRLIEKNETTKLTNKSKTILSATQSYHYATYPRAYITSLEKVSGDISDSYYKVLRPSDIVLSSKAAQMKTNKSLVIATPQRVVSSKKMKSSYIITMAVDIKAQSTDANNRVKRDQTTKNFAVTWKKEGKEYKITSIKETR